MTKSFNPRVDEAIETATRTLLRRGSYRKLSMEAIARAAGVGKASLYRRWPNQAHLCFDVIFRPLPLQLDPSLSWRAALIRIVQVVAQAIASEEAQCAIPGLLEACQSDPVLAARMQRRFLGPIYIRLQLYLARGQSEQGIGELDEELFMDMLFGAVLIRSGVRRRPMDDTAAAKMVDLLLGGVQIPPPGSSPS